MTRLPKAVKGRRPDDLYRRKSNGRYEFAGYANVELPPGLWLVMEPPRGRGKSYRNIMHRLNEVPDWTDVRRMTEAVMLEDLICEQLVKMFDEGSKPKSLADHARDVANGVYERLIELDEACGEFSDALEESRYED